MSLAYFNRIKFFSLCLIFLNFSNNRFLIAKAFLKVPLCQTTTVTIKTAFVTTKSRTHATPPYQSIEMI